MVGGHKLFTPLSTAVIQSFHKRLLNIYCVPGAGMNTGDTEGKKTDNSPLFMEKRELYYGNGGGRVQTITNLNDGQVVRRGCLGQGILAGGAAVLKPPV